jgi:hypothetical protein
VNWFVLEPTCFPVMVLPDRLPGVRFGPGIDQSQLRAGQSRGRRRVRCQSPGRGEPAARVPHPVSVSSKTPRQAKKGRP